MLYAWPVGEVDRTDLGNRIRADEHGREEGVCPLHGCTVVSKIVNGIWQWMHEDGCTRARRSPRGAGPVRRTIAVGFLNHVGRSASDPCECVRLWHEAMVQHATEKRLPTWKNSGGTYCPHGVLLVPAGEQPPEIEAERARRADRRTKCPST